MKQTFNLLAEMLALPFSELFLQEDLLEECVAGAWRSHRDGQVDVSVLGKQIGRMGVRAAGYINLHTSFSDVSLLQNMVNYLYSAEDIACIAGKAVKGVPLLGTPRAVVNHYYSVLIRRAAKTFLTTRNGKAAFKYWPGSQEAAPYAAPPGPQRREPDWTQDLLGSHFGTHRIEAWHSLLQCLPESLLLSCYAACLAENTNESEKRTACFQILLHAGSAVQIGDLLLDKVLDQGLAETHLHAGASRSFDRIWEGILCDAAHDQKVLEHGYTPIFQKEISQETSCARAREALIVRTLLAACLCSHAGSLTAFLRDSNACRIEPGSRFSFLQTVDGLTQRGEAPFPFSAAVSWIRPFLQNMSGCRNGEYLPQLLHIPERISLTDVGFADRFWIAWALLHLEEKPEDISFTAVFLYYLRLKNYFYRSRIQDSKSKGLSYFQGFYSQSTDAGSQSKERRAADQLYTALMDPRILKTEFRISPPSSAMVRLKDAQQDIYRKLESQIALFISQHLYVVALLYGSPAQGRGSDWAEKAFTARWHTARQRIYHGKTGELERLLEECGVCVSKIHRHRIGLVYHFIKRGEGAEESACFLKNGGETELSRHAAFSFGKSRFQCQAAVHAISRIRQLSPELSRLIVGLDAASLELSTEPWVFTPAFRLARELDRIPLFQKESPNGMADKRTLGLTYHVGEEFRHPLSGLRHISEAVEFYKMHTGDRLGHALALGIDLDRWFSSHRLIPLSQIEWMENSLWAWKILVQNPAFAPLSGYLKHLEAQILSCAHEIYGTLDGISVEKLYAAYRNKSLDYPDLDGLSRSWRAKYNPSAGEACLKHAGEKGRGFFPCVQQEEGGPEFWWSEDSLTMSYHCGFYKARMAKERIWEPDAQEQALVQQLQDYLRDKIAEKGIVLEENPSSNAVIGEMDGILFHPIYNLRTPERSAAAVMTTINTDDPSVFNSSVANEHALIYFALIHQGYSVEEALKAVDELRNAGLASSFIPDPPPFSELLAEYENILSVLSPLR